MEVLQRTANRGSISTDTGYNIDNSYKNENDNTERMYRGWGGITANTRTWTVSLWVKRTELGACYLWGAGVSGNDVVVVNFDSSDRLGFRSTKSAANDCVYLTNRVFRDTSAWYHLVFAVDTTSGTAGNRLRIYVNGVEETSFATETNFDQNDLTLHNANGSYMEVGSVIGESPRFNGYIAEVNSITGTQYAPTAFGEVDDDSGIWIPILFAGSYAENSVFLEFKDSSSLGTDTSGNGQTFTLQNLSAADQSTDTPTNNFATLNPLHKYSGTASHNPIINEGATRWTTGRAGYWAAGIATMGLTSGKWYFEAQPGTANSHITDIGYGDESDIHDWARDQADTNGFPGENGTNSIGYLGSDTSSSYGNIWLGTGSTSNVNANYTISNIVGVAIDADNGFVYFAKDNTYVNSGNPGSGANGTGGYEFEDTTTTRTGTVFPAVGGYYHTAATVINVNFGGYTTISISSAATDENGYGTFEYAPPSGYYALCTKNLAEYG